MPSANTKTVFPPFSSADLCAAKSVPAAYPLITVIFSFVSCREQSAAIPIPFADAFLEPQKPTAILLSKSILPETNSMEGHLSCNIFFRY